jgi:hypothetical protein
VNNVLVISLHNEFMSLQKSLPTLQGKKYGETLLINRTPSSGSTSKPLAHESNILPTISISLTQNGTNTTSRSIRSSYDW